MGLRVIGNGDDSLNVAARKNKGSPRAAFEKAGCLSSAQAGSVVGNGLDLDVGKLGGDHAHHFFRVVGALFGTEGLQLDFGVLGELAGQTRILGRHAGTGRAVATGTGRDALLEVALAPQLPAEGDAGFVFGGFGLQFLAGVPGGDVAHVFVGQRSDHAGHDCVVAGGGFAVDRLEIGQLLVDVLFDLAGQIEQYIYKQLTNFKSVDGKPAARDNAIMAGMVAALTDEDMRNVSAWYASQKLKPEAAKNEASIALGRKLWRQGDFKKGIPACAGCHGPAGAGMPAQYPRLAGQFAEYTEVQLKAFRAEERANDPEKMMRMIAAKLSDVEIKAVSDYAAGLR